MCLLTKNLCEDCNSVLFMIDTIGKYSIYIRIIVTCICDATYKIFHIYY